MDLSFLYSTLHENVAENTLAYLTKTGITVRVLRCRSCLELLRSRSRIFGRLEPRAGAAFLPPAPAAFRKAKKISIALEVSSLFKRTNMMQNDFISNKIFQSSVVVCSVFLVEIFPVFLIFRKAHDSDRIW